MDAVRRAWAFTEPTSKSVLNFERARTCFLSQVSAPFIEKRTTTRVFLSPRVGARACVRAPRGRLTVGDCGVVVERDGEFALVHGLRRRRGWAAFLTNKKRLKNQGNRRNEWRRLELPAACPHRQYRFAFRSRFVTRAFPGTIWTLDSSTDSHGSCQTRTLSIVFARHRPTQLKIQRNHESLGREPDLGRECERLKVTDVEVGHADGARLV